MRIQVHSSPTARSTVGGTHHLATSPLLPAMDLFALEDDQHPEVVSLEPWSFEALQDKARREGVTGLSAQEKAAYLEFLQRKPTLSGVEPPLPSSTDSGACSTAARLPTFRAGQRTLIYAGIGSRETPEDVRAKMQELAGYLEAKNYTLRTGDAVGAASAFAAGCQRKQIFRAADATELALEIALEAHPAPWLLPTYAKQLMARSTYIICGAELDTPVDFVLCWTEDACTSHATRTRETGEPGQAIDLASSKGIPVINLKNENWRDQLKEALANAGVR